jgi:periplasmic divalent cation tolerance protein
MHISPSDESVEFIQVMTTTDKQELAERIAQQLVEDHLAACVQVVGPITSTYRWQGRVESAQEWLCLAKTRLGLFAEVEAAIREIHTYEKPEILAVPVTAGSAAYLEWLAREVSS